MIRKENLLSKKAGITYLEILTLIIASFSFAYLIAPEKENREGLIVSILASIIKKLNKPLIEIASAETITTAVCCEKTLSGAWCQNAPASECDAAYKQTPTSCDATSFCKNGCCYDSSEGTCAENTPQNVCNANEGSWADSSQCEIPQCSLGCCVLDTQAAFVTLTRCKKLSGFYGLETDFRPNINNELSCIATTQLLDRGACVYDVDFISECSFTTRENCVAGSIVANGTLTGNFTFYKDYLCSAEELGTKCGPTSETSCVPGKDEVYFLDSCGNPANIYDASKLKDKSYWKKIIDKAESCGAGNTNGNSNSKDCGNCDYFSGSFCREAERGNKPAQGDFICADLSCQNTYDGNDYRNGESWCVNDKDENSVGARYFKHVCVNGEEILEPCADFRQETCIQDSISTDKGVFQQAGCRANMWQDCTSQDTQEDCENTDKRDCKWNEDSQSVKCVPENEPGLKHYGTAVTKTTGAAGTQQQAGQVITGASVDSEASGICAQANTQCIVSFEKRGFIGDNKPECYRNCECLSDSWIQKQNSVCTQLGDCGGKANFVGASSYKAGYATTQSKIEAVVEKLLLPVAKLASWVVFGDVGVVASQPAATSQPAAGSAGAGTEVLRGIPQIHNTKLIEIPKEWVWKISSTSYSSGENLVKVNNFVLKETLSKNDVTYQAIFNDGEILYDIDKTEAIRLAQEHGLTNQLAVTKAMEINTLNSGGIKFASAFSETSLPRGYVWQSYNLGADGKTITGIIKTPSGQEISVQGEVGKNLNLQTQQQAGGGAGNILQAIMADPLIGNLLWGFTVGSIAGLIAGLIAPENSNAGQAAFWGFTAGAFTQGLTYTALTGKMLLGGQAQSILPQLFKQAAPGKLNIWLGEGGLGLSPTAGFIWSTLAGIGVAILITNALYKEKNQELVTFSCNVWQAPIGGADCEKCNQDEFKPCSEYRCKSLGQACELLNAGSSEENCAWVNRKDVKSPGISPWNEALLEGYSYIDVRIRPPGDGSEPGRMKIVKDGSKDGCVQAFTPLSFGINTVGSGGESEPAQCKIDYVHTEKFDDMKYFFGGSNLFLYNHSQIMALPGPENLKQEAPELKNDGTYSLYVRCQDANGNQNVDEFTIRFCVDKGPDITPPSIEATSIINGMPVSYGLNETSLDVYVNEPSECRWDRLDRSYENMENDMSCARSITEINNNLLYKCSTILTGIKNRDENLYYFRCKDQPLAEESERNVNTQSYEFKLIGTEPLNILKTSPNNQTIKGYETFVPVNLEIETANGYKQGDALCYYSLTGNEKDYVQFFETTTNIHKQRQDLPGGSYTYYFKCVDLGGNTAYDSINFKVEVDQQAPEIVRAYNYPGPTSLCGGSGCLQIITDEKSTCSYSKQNCNFDIEAGEQMPYQDSEEHYAEWKTNIIYHIRCKDESGNEPLPNRCSIIVRGYEL